MTKEDILVLLREGKDADTIANDLISTLNEANKIFEEEKEKKAKREKEIYSNKQVDMAEIMRDLFKYLQKYYPDIFSSKECELAKRFSAQALVRDIDRIMETFEPLLQPKRNRTADQIIQEFLSSSEW